MARFSQERKEAVLSRLLPPYNMTVSELAKMEGISEATLYNWRKQVRLRGRAARHVRIVVRSSESVKRRWRAQEDTDGSILNGAQRGCFEKVTAAQ
ncbi:MAG: hypothetical protein CMK70_14235 [Pseudohongiella sp.]|nr:hypothetical protein [Pseudohongiella sp.]